MLPRLRLDFVLNNFVACVLSTGEITVLSDGSPWRPLIDTEDMACAISWAAERDEASGGRFLLVNARSGGGNRQVWNLAQAVARAVPGTTVSINTVASADSCSYQVDFGLYAAIAPRHSRRGRSTAPSRASSRGCAAWASPTPALATRP